MANDIAPALLKKLQKAFAEKFNQNKKIQELYQAIQEGKATYAEVNGRSLRWERGLKYKSKVKITA